MESDPEDRCYRPTVPNLPILPASEGSFKVGDVVRDRLKVLRDGEPQSHLIGVITRVKPLVIVDWWEVGRRSLGITPNAAGSVLAIVPFARFCDNLQRERNEARARLGEVSSVMQDDMAALADALGVDRSGWQGSGSPHELMCGVIVPVARRTRDERDEARDRVFMLETVVEARNLALELTMRERNEARANARILAHSYATGNRPPDCRVQESMDYPTEAPTDD